MHFAQAVRRGFWRLCMTYIIPQHSDNYLMPFSIHIPELEERITTQ
jgi:hypothetical protein